MSIDSSIQYLEEIIKSKAKDSSYEKNIYKTAVNALKYQKYHGKFNNGDCRRCKKCTEVWNYNDYIEWEEGELGEVRILSSKGEMCVDVGAYWETVKINYCPFCGRLLDGAEGE